MFFLLFLFLDYQNKGFLSYKGYYRKLARKFYKQRREIYRQRGRGESPFESLNNEFGDRFKAINKTTMQVRILGRVISYQIKLLIRCNNKIISIDVLIIRHTLNLH